jgi:putative DNA primase/helicase
VPSRSPASDKTVASGGERASPQRGLSTAGMMHTDMGNAERLVAAFGDGLRYCPPRKAWLIWDGRRWAIDETGEIMRLAKRTVRAIYREAEYADTPDDARAVARHAQGSEKAARLEALVQLARSEPGVAVMPAELDAEPLLLNCLNGTLDLRTGSLRPHSPRDLLTKLVPIDYDSTARCSRWQQFIVDVTGGDVELAGFLQRVAGYCMTGMQTEKQFFFVYSALPSTGKSTFADALRAALGEYCVDADFGTWLEQAVGGNRGDLARLIGARLVLSLECRRNARFDTKLVKAITGGDPITCAPKYGHEFTYTPAFKIVLVANDAPAIRDDDRPMFERCLRVPFDVQIPSARRDPTLKAWLSDPAGGAPSVLRWAVEGCLAWQRLGLRIPRAVERSSMAYRGEMDQFRRFIEECCVLEPLARCSKGELRAAYVAWCNEGNGHPFGAQEINLKLGELGVVSAKSNATRIFRGIRLSGDGDLGSRGGTLGTVCPDGSGTRSQTKAMDQSFENGGASVPLVPLSTGATAGRSRAVGGGQCG